MKDLQDIKLERLEDSLYNYLETHSVRKGEMSDDLKKENIPKMECFEIKAGHEIKVAKMFIAMFDQRKKM